jgi:hypothetical protein
MKHGRIRLQLKTLIEAKKILKSLEKGFIQQSFQGRESLDFSF